MDSSVRVPKRQAGGVEPSINTIETTQTMVKMVRFPGFERTLPGSDRALPIIGMNRITGGPTLPERGPSRILQIFERPAEVFLRAFVNELDLTARGHGSYQRRDAVHERREHVLIDPVCDPLWCA